jgi:hypothetical protein
VNILLEGILGACVDKKKISKKDAHEKYLKGNEVLPREVDTLLNAIQFLIMQELNVLHMNASDFSTPFFLSQNGSNLT